MLTFRDLTADEIEVRVGNTTKDKSGNVIAFNLLLYKTARVDANVLDDTVGAYNWQKRFYQVKNTMVCSVGIYFEDRKEWVWKDDGGDDDTTMEQIKAELSDSFKRAGFAWGIGRKLYTASKIFMRVDRTESNTEKGYYQVSEIAYDDTSITKLVIVNKKTKEVVISYGTNAKVSKITPTTQKKPITDSDKEFITDYVGTLSADMYKKFFEKLDFVYHAKTISDLSEEQGKQLVEKLVNGK